MGREVVTKSGVIEITEQMEALKREVAESRRLGNGRDELYPDAMRAKWKAYFLRRDVTREEFSCPPSDCPDLDELLRRNSQPNPKPKSDPILLPMTKEQQQGVADTLQNQVKAIHESLVSRMREDPLTRIPISNIPNLKSVSGKEPYFFYERIYSTKQGEQVLLTLEVGGENNGKIVIHSVKNPPQNFLPKLSDKIAISHQGEIEIETNHREDGSQLRERATYKLPLTTTPDRYRFEHLCGAVRTALRIASNYFSIPLVNYHEAFIVP